MQVSQSRIAKEAALEKMLCNISNEETKISAQLLKK